jgi:tetratricopeptide (TPR) repeat protein
VDHGVAGFYNYVGDMHLLQGNEAYAITFYEQSSARSFQNHRANYALATMKTSRLNFDGAQYNYNLANAKRPTEFSLVNGGNLSFWWGRHFDAIASFKKAEKVTPASAQLLNNLGYAYANVHRLDSASIYMSRARENDATRESSDANFFAMAARELIPIKTDSVLKLFNAESPIVTSNAIALATLFGQKIDIDVSPQISPPLNLYTATLLNNYINYHATDLDTAFIHLAYNISSDTNNIDYREALKASIAHAYYHQGRVYKAMEVLGELAYITQNYQGKYNYIMGLWSLEQGATERALSFFTHAEVANYKHAKFYHAIALTESGLAGQAIVAWDSLYDNEEEGIRAMSFIMKKILELPAAQAVSMSDPEKYQFCRYRIPLTDTTRFFSILKTIDDPNYKAKALVDRATKFYETDKISSAIKVLNQINGLELTDEKLFDDVKHLELLLLAARRDLVTLSERIKNVKFGEGKQLHQLLYSSMLVNLATDSLTIIGNYNLLATSNPYFEEGILVASEFFRNQDQESLKSYNILVEAIYVNPQSLRLLKAYASEAARMGFDEYAKSARERLGELGQ